MNKLIQSDSARFKILDASIKKNLTEAAESLKEIRDKELYRAGGHKSFKDYCVAIGRSYPWAWQQIKKAETPQISVPKRVLRLSERSEGDKTPKTHSNPISAPQRRGNSTIKDETGIPIPPEIMDFWNRNQEAVFLLSMISKVRTTLEKAQEEDDPLFRFVDFTNTIGKLRSVSEEIQCAKSFAVCPDCNGVMSEDCTTCRKRGTMPKFFWSMIDEQKKAMRK